MKLLKAYTEQEIMEMGPEKLTSILYKALIEKLEQAIKTIDNKDYIATNYFLQGCNDILQRLGGGINYKAGIIADHLEALYNYSSEKLIEANLEKDKKSMEDVLKIMENLQEAWEEGMKIAEKESYNDNKLDSYEKHLYYETTNLDILE